VQDKKFSSFNIPADDIFAESMHSYAFVNLKPMVPGMCHLFKLEFTASRNVLGESK
jgi:hypothetical protein